MQTATGLHEKLEFLMRSTGRAEAEIVAAAVEAGISEFHRQEIADAYLAGDVARDRAVSELGEGAVEEMDYARSAIERDVRWGLQ